MSDYVQCFVKRPDGKYWKPRKPPRALMLNDCEQVLVVRCSDEQEALRLAAEEIRAYDPGCEPGHGYFSWWHQGIERGEAYWRYESARGAPGWMFDVISAVGCQP